MQVIPHAELRRRFREACNRMGAGEGAVIYRTAPAHDGSAHVETIADEYHYVVTERGSESGRRVTADPDELLYWLVADVAFALASVFERQHRVQGQSFRRLLFAKEVELLGAVKPAWAGRRQKEIDAILGKHPYDDAIEG